MSEICKEAEAVESVAEYPSLFQALRECTAQVTTRKSFFIQEIFLRI
jgi:hypothetical protein